MLVTKLFYPDFNYRSMGKLHLIFYIKMKKQGLFPSIPELRKLSHESMWSESRCHEEISQAAKPFSHGLVSCMYILVKASPSPRNSQRRYWHMICTRFTLSPAQNLSLSHFGNFLCRGEYRKGFPIHTNYISLLNGHGFLVLQICGSWTE